MRWFGPLLLAALAGSPARADGPPATWQAQTLCFYDVNRDAQPDLVGLIVKPLHETRVRAVDGASGRVLWTSRAFALFARFSCTTRAPVVTTPRPIALDPRSGREQAGPAPQQQRDESTHEATLGALTFSLAAGGTLADRLQPLTVIAGRAGTRVWSVPLDTFAIQFSTGRSLDAADGRVYVAGASADRKQTILVALDAATGRRVWTRALDRSPTLHHDLRARGRLVYLFSNFVLDALDGATGGTRWESEGKD
jgi:hypothetical protein